MYFPRGAFSPVSPIFRGLFRWHGNVIWQLGQGISPLFVLLNQERRGDISTDHAPLRET